MASSGSWLPLLLATLAAALSAASCQSASTKEAPPPAPAPPIASPAAGVAEEPGPSGAPAFDSSKVTEEEKTATFVDVRSLIDSLNRIIRRQDYEAWLSNLTDSYIRYYSDPAVLAQYSEFPVLKRKGVELKTLKDYFLYVVYPSRQNDKVDDIEFVGERLVKAITVSPKGERTILYMLEKHGDAWKIGIGR